MFKNHPIDTVRVEHVTAHTVVLDVQTAAPLHLVWPNVRGNYADVPYGLRAVSTVFQKKMGTEDFGEVREALILSLIHISEPTRRLRGSRMPSSA